MTRSRICGEALALVLLLATVCHADELELLNGTRIKGKLVEQTAQKIRFEVTSGEHGSEMTFPVSKVHAVTVAGERQVLNERPAKEAKAPPTPKAAEPEEPGAEPEPEPTAPKAKGRTRAQVEALIQKAGTTPPEWWDSVPLEYPETLDLTWPKQAPGPWNPQKNVGQYVWSVINENPSRWKSGVRFLHHLLTVNRDRPDSLIRVMDALGSAYFNLMEDWARAAFWWRKTEARGALSWHATLRLAECYWRLGSRELAMGMLHEASEYYATGIIKLWACLGDLDKALREAEGMAKAGAPDDAYLAAGDACRLLGKSPQAIAYYQKVLDVPATGREQKRIERNQARARASKEAVETFETIDLKRVPDGTYKASSVAYERTLEVAVVVKAGRIESVRVTQHHEKQFYTALTAPAQQIVERQSVKGIDMVSGATITAEAVVNAAAKALSAAMK